MTVRFRQDRGWWEYSLELGKGPDGKRRQARAGGFPRKKDAQEAEDEYKRLNAGGVGLDNKATMAAFLAQWLDVRSTKLVESTHQRYGEIIRLHIEPVIGKVQVRKLSPLQVQSVYSSMRDKGLAERTAEQAHAIMHASLKQAVRWQLLNRNPADLVDKPTPERPPTKTPTIEQTRQLLELGDSTKFGRVFWLCALAGCRDGEALALRWSCVDFAASTIELKANARRKKGERIVIYDRTKGKRIRTVALPSAGIGLLAEQRQLQKKDRELAGEDYLDDDLVFADAVGRPLNCTWIQAVWKRDVARPLGLEGVRIHDLRHGFVSHLLAKGFSPKLVQEMVGHQTAAFTLDRYAHVLPSMQAEAAEAMGRMLTDE